MRLRALLVTAVFVSAVNAQTTSTRCSAVEVSVFGVTDLRLVGCGEGFPDNLLWHLDRADSLSGALDGTVTRKATGKGAVVYMCDTGVMRDHDEFARADGSAVIGAITLGGPSKDCGAGHDPALEPCFSNDAQLVILTHGTATASMVAGRNTGIAPDAKIVSVYAMAAGNSILAWIATLNLIIQHAWDPRTPQFKTGIINMSFTPGLASSNDPSFPQFEKKMREMIDGVDANGNPDPNGKRFLFVTVAGNYTTGAGNQCTAQMTSNLYPAVLGASIDGLITVAGIDRQNRVWDRTCRGDVVDVFAPAESLLLASISGRDHYRSGQLYSGYPQNSGTSYSAPYVAGLAALLLEKNPDLTPQEIERIIKGTPSRVAHAEDATADGRVAVFDWVSRPARQRSARH